MPVSYQSTRTATTSMEEMLRQYHDDMQQELQHILAYWMQHATDNEHGGFYGRIAAANKVDAKADKGAVLNSRILWTFSAAYNSVHNNEYLTTANRAFEYIVTHFFDKEHGGVYWSVDYKGEPADTKKQVYAMAFALYGMSEYYRCRQSVLAQELSIHLFNTIEKYSYDPVKGGYLEAFARDWQPIQDLRLSSKDANEKKTMNTHLHVLEAYTSLYKNWPDTLLKTRIESLIDNFLEHIIDTNTHHLVLFFDEQWNRKSETISYGHDIEAAWLLYEAAEAIGNKELLQKTAAMAIAIANAAAEGLDKDGGLWYEYDLQENHLIKEKHWWPQAEAMVGFFNAWQLSNDKKFIDYSINAWRFVQQHVLDKQYSEWYWGIQEDYSVMPGQDKVGIWKCPYHNSRACIEIMRRITV
jgi:mannobiose 2-epimerase